MTTHYLMQEYLSNAIQVRHVTLRALMATMLVSLAFSAVASAGNNDAWPPSFEDFDKNADGLIDPREFIALQNQRLQALPKDADTQLSEIVNFSFSSLDTNGDQLIARSEYLQDLASERNRSNTPRRAAMPSIPGFLDFDSNGDGKIEKEEFYQTRNARIQERAEAGMPMRRLPEAPTFEQIDTNNDGVVDKEEFLLHRKSHWPGGPKTQ